MLSRMKCRKGFTLVEVLIAFLILAVGITGVYMLFLNSSYFTNQSNHVAIATREATALMETIQSMSLSEVKAQRANSTFWQSYVADILPDIAATVSNVDSSDTNWNNDPLELEVTVEWTERAAKQNITMMSAFTDG